MKAFIVILICIFFFFFFPYVCGSILEYLEKKEKTGCIMFIIFGGILFMLYLNIAGFINGCSSNSYPERDYYEAPRK